MSSNVKIIQPFGTLDRGAVNKLRREITNVVESGATVVLVDFQDVTFMNSAGLGAFVSIHKAVRSAGAELFLCSLNEQVKMFFELTRVDLVFKPFASRKEFEEKVASIG